MSESYRVVQVSTLLDETPEGQYHMDRIRTAASATDAELDRLLTPEARERIERELDRRMLFGTEKRNADPEG